MAPSLQDTEAMEISDSDSAGSDISTSSGEVDAEVQEARNDRKNKRRRAQQLESKERNKIQKIATSRPLPHSSSTLSASVTGFVKFMMGIATAASPLPDPPTEDEVSAWTNHVENRKSMVTNKISPGGGREKSTAGSMSTAETAARNRSNEKFLRDQKLDDIRIAGLSLVKYNAAPTIRSNLPISLQTKIICDKSFQLKGFPRITFEWNATSLSVSQWNTATALLLIENWSSWYKTQPHSIRDLEEDIEGVIQRWLRSMKISYRKQLKSSSGDDVDSSGSLPKQLTSRTTSTAAAKAFEQRKKERKKICAHRHAAAKSIFPQNSSFTILFKNIDSVSDYEDNADATQPRCRIIPRWRSEIFTKVAHQLDEAAKQLESDKKKRANLTNLLRRGSTKHESLEAEDPMKVPNKFPVDSYNPNYLQELTPIESGLLKAKEAIGLESFFNSICTQTMRTASNTGTNPVMGSHLLHQNVPSGWTMPSGSTGQ